MTESTLADLCLQVTDGTHDSPRLLPQGVPFIKGKHINKGFVDFENCDYISYEDHLKVIARSKPEQGDILFAAPLPKV
jgi:type I restriction enzyme S subunit